MSRVADYRCDRCGWTDASQVPSDPDRLPEGWAKLNIHSDDHRSEYTWDVCPRCRDDLVAWVTTPVDAHNGAELQDGTGRVLTDAELRQMPREDLEVVAIEAVDHQYADALKTGEVKPLRNYLRTDHG